MCVGSRVAAVLIAAGLVVGGCGPAASPDPVGVTGPPRIHFASYEQDLGEVAIEPRQIEVVFRFTNRGLSPLQLTSVTRFCACASAEAPSGEVDPGGESTVVLRITPSEAGERETTVVVHTNDPANPNVPLAVRWRAVAPIELIPPEIDFGVLRPGESRSRTATVAVRDPSFGEITKIEADPTQLHATFTGRTLRLILAADRARGRDNGLVTVHFGDADPLALPVRWRVRGFVEATPASLFLGSGYPGEVLSGRVVLDFDRDALFDDYTTAIEDLADAEVSADKISSGRGAVVAVRWKLPARPGRHVGRLRVARTDGAGCDIDVPISAFVLDTVARGEVP